MARRFHFCAHAGAGEQNGSVTERPSAPADGDAQTQVWLDLDSGQEVTRAVEQGAPAGDTEGAGATCARLDPLFPAILEWVRSVEIPWHQFAPEGVVFPLAA